MSVSYDPSDLPPETVEVDGRVWKREQFDSDAYQWMREMEPDEYDWNKEEVDIVGGGEPVRMVTLQFLDGGWEIQGSETAGPKYHRPGFCELISSEYAATFDDLDAASEKVEEFLRDLS
jgi:hypothetical protein